MNELQTDLTMATPPLQHQSFNTVCKENLSYEQSVTSTCIHLILSLLSYTGTINVMDRKV